MHKKLTLTPKTHIKKKKKVGTLVHVYSLSTDCIETSCSLGLNHQPE